MASVRRWLVTAAVLLHMASHCRALIETFSVSPEYGSNTAQELVQRFGMERGAEVHMTVTVEPEPEVVYVALFPRLDWDAWHQAGAAQAAVMMCTFPSAMRYELRGSYTFNHTVEFADLYTLQVLRCDSRGDVTVSGEVTLVNPNAGHSFKHLSTVDAPLPRVLLGVAWLLVVLIVWYGFLLLRYRDTVMPFQYAFFIILVTRLVEVALSLRYYSNLGQTGSNDDALHKLADSAQVFSTTTLLLTLLLTALGWTVTRRNISGRETLAISTLFLAYLVIGVLEALCQGGEDCRTFGLTEYILRSVVMLAVIVALNFNITHLRIQLHDSTWTPSSPLSYIKLRLYQQFRWMFLAFLLLPTELLIVRVAVLSWRYEWVVLLLEELFLIGFYGGMSWIYRPRKFDDFDIVGHVLDRTVQASPSVSVQ